MNTDKINSKGKLHTAEIFKRYLTILFCGEKRLIFLMSILGIFLTISMNPVMSDDIYTALLNSEINLVNKSIISSQNPLDLTTCKDCFSKHSFINRDQIRNGLHHSAESPILYITINNNKFPIFFNLRSSGFPYVIIKSIADISFPALGITAFNFLIFILTAFVFNNFLKLFLTKKQRYLTLFILLLSPIYYLQNLIFLSEKLTPLGYFLTLQLIFSQKKSNNTIAILTFLIFSLMKLTFAPIFLLSYFALRKRDPNWRANIILMGSIFLTILSMYALGTGFTSEYVARSDQGFFLKTWKDWWISIVEGFSILVHSNSSLYLYLAKLNDFPQSGLKFVTQYGFLDGLYFLITLIGLIIKKDRKLCLNILGLSILVFIPLIFISRTQGFYAHHLHPLIFSFSALLAIGLLNIFRLKKFGKTIIAGLLIIHIIKFLLFCFEINTREYNIWHSNKVIKRAIPFIKKEKLTNIFSFKADARGALEFYSQEHVSAYYFFDFDSIKDLSFIFKNTPSGTLLIESNLLSEKNYKEKLYFTAANNNKKIVLLKRFFKDDELGLEIYSFSPRSAGKQFSHPPIIK